MDNVSFSKDALRTDSLGWLRNSQRQPQEPHNFQIGNVDDFVPDSNLYNAADHLENIPNEQQQQQPVQQQHQMTSPSNSFFNYKSIAKQIFAFGSRANNDVLVNGASRNTLLSFFFN
eukprot:gb/GECH01011574.1/.p1 GENE.gb/GECH01011574.1/~~gb/GECH01011574.1/.p1  ORF type:complete len:117 (+),score=26.61 gb/GECH01011574.1/:1-351(+)